MAKTGVRRIFCPPPDDTQGIKGPRAKGLNQNESVVYNLSTVYITSAGVSHSLCLPCGGSPCQVGVVTRSDNKSCNLQTPVCCKSGEYVKSGYCGCCLQCAKAEGEECGGDWEEKGRCASGMACRYSSPSQGKCRKPRKASGGLGNSQPGKLP